MAQDAQNANDLLGKLGGSSESGVVNADPDPPEHAIAGATSTAFGGKYNAQIGAASRSISMQGDDDVSPLDPNRESMPTTFIGALTPSRLRKLTEMMTMMRISSS